MLKKTLALFAGLLVTVAVYAAGAQLRPGHPDTYVVKKGDTLWDISARFLQKPWLWPEIWQANPQVHNPHLIYPGDVLNLSYDGQHVMLKPRMREVGSAIPAIPLDDLKMFLEDMRVLSSDTLKKAPYVVGFEQNMPRGVTGQFVYVRGLDAKPGQRWAIVRPTHMFRQFDDAPMRVAHTLDSNVGMVNGPWQEDSRHDGHYGKGEEVGVEVRVIGTAKVLRGGDPSTLLVTDSSREIRKGDRVLPVNDKPYDPYYYPHAPKSLPDHARVIAFTDSLNSAGRREVVALSVGSSDGVNNGQTYAVFQPGDRIHDDVASSSMLSGIGERVTLPDEFVGHVMVFRTFDHVSYGLIMDGVRPVRTGDVLRLPE
ncbi:LysM domain-containing protein [Oleiagrimonas sp. MCCC 1A03011]|uniref:LysM peptidoglycan-binding domain-containing protein n=1 Tax=Oleiagrimonas sp. MCCC 1A03011 TaxID=1926883 RepID=UPI000DC5ED75|nr:LysM domain-containing protein [Oleiagrimonas sp. MCCC 1A03011]RAP56878.1 peptidoglycan-binding protein [Oleiagrimonas sp. MCCC 1A03011]